MKILVFELFKFLDTKSTGFGLYNLHNGLVDGDMSLERYIKTAINSDTSSYSYNPFKSFLYIRI